MLLVEIMIGMRQSLIRGKNRSVHMEKKRAVEWQEGSATQQAPGTSQLCKSALETPQIYLRKYLRHIAVNPFEYSGEANPPYFLTTAWIFW